jgi:hypothetical protein
MGGMTQYASHPHSFLQKIVVFSLQLVADLCHLMAT